MEKVTYQTLAECEAAINTLRAIGVAIPDWMESQHQELTAAANARTVATNTDTPIFDTLVANYPYGKMPEEKVKCIKDTVSQLLEDGEHAEEPGLLLGKIQCGKTDTFEDIIGLAFDKGIDITIVFTKGTKPLAQQTIMRMKKDYRFFKPSDNLDQKATINIYDIMNVWNKLKQAKVEGCKTVIVCKKQSTNMSHLIDMFSKNCTFLKKKKVLIVDDEADFASRNYRSVKLQALMDDDGNPMEQDAQTEMAKISQQIDDFRKIPDYCRYLQVTATPYCLYLQPQGELNLNDNVVKPFKPRFTSIVPVHAAYIGGQQYFEDSRNPDSMYNHLYHQIEQKCVDVLGHEDKRYLNNSVSSANIYGLTYALISYFMATAIRRIQERKVNNRDYKTSALIHVELDKKNHEWQSRVINRLIDSIKSAIVDEDQSDQRIWTAIDSIYDDFVESNRKGREENLTSVDLPMKEDVMNEIRNIFNPKKNNYHVQIVNSDEQVESLLDEETGELQLDTAANIFIGGNILDRGITIKNMLCFFYGRNPKKFQQDTVLQHARMYGARSKEDMAVTRLHTTSHIYKILVRMNELDNQLREWFLEGRDKGTDMNAVFVGYDKNIKPCAAQKIKASNALTLTRQMRMVPAGFWTGCNTAIKKTIAQIDALIETSPNFDNKDENGFFEMDCETVKQILLLIESTYVYKDNGNIHNFDRKNDIKEMLCALEYCASKSGGKVLVLQRTNRNMRRLRANGGYIDAPDDGRTDVKPSRDKAIDIPVVMLLRQNGKKSINPATGENIGWNDAPFYWPVLMTQLNINPVMFAIEQGKKKKTFAADSSNILEGIDPNDVLDITFCGDLEDRFGSAGSEYTYNTVKDNEEVEECPWESRTLKESTASRYIEKDEDGQWKINPEVHFNKQQYHGLYSLNDGVFPFVLKPYKYMLLRNKRDANADLMLLELFPTTMCETKAEGKLDDNGDLIDRDTKKVLFHGTDIITDKDMNKTDFTETGITQWILYYYVHKVLKYVPHHTERDENSNSQPEEDNAEDDNVNE